MTTYDHWAWLVNKLSCRYQSEQGKYLSHVKVVKILETLMLSEQKPMSNIFKLFQTHKMTLPVRELEVFSVTQVFSYQTWTLGRVGVRTKSIPDQTKSNQQLLFNIEILLATWFKTTAKDFNNMCNFVGKIL